MSIRGAINGSLSVNRKNHKFEVPLNFVDELPKNQAIALVLAVSQSFRAYERDEGRCGCVPRCQASLRR